MTNAHKLLPGCTRAALALACVAVASCAAPGPGPVQVQSGLVLQNVTVVDVRAGRVQPGMNVVIDNGQIREVTPRPVQAGAAAVVVDAPGKFVVPGYMDMHTHALPRAAQQPHLWPLFVAHGITGVREMAGSPELIQAAQALNAQSAAGRVVAPEVTAIAGPLFVGAPNAQAAAALVGQHKAMGASFVKAIAGSREATLAMLAEARKQALPVAGHTPLFVTAEEAAAAGWTSIEHLGAGLGIMLDCAADPDAIRQAIARGEGARPPFSPAVILTPMLFRAMDAPFYKRVLETYDARKCEAIAASFARHKTWQVPSLIRVRTMMYSDAAQYRNHPDLVYVDKATRAQWENLGQQYERVPRDATDAFRAYYEQQKKLLPMFRRAGVPMVTGSDFGGIWVVAGASLHHEFAELAAAGLAPLDILQMITLNAAAFLGRGATEGAVEPGKRANLVLLDANPLDDVAHLGRIHSVVLNGRHHAPEALARMKAEAVAAAAR